jgi:hypothetical protein
MNIRFCSNKTFVRTQKRRKIKNKKIRDNPYHYLIFRCVCISRIGHVSQSVTCACFAYFGNFGYFGYFENFGNFGNFGNFENFRIFRTFTYFAYFAHF